MTPREVLALCREKDVKAVDLRFCDLLGAWQHVTIPVARLDEAAFEDGVGFDGSFLPGGQGFERDDLLVLPQPETAFLDPFLSIPTLALIGGLRSAGTGDAHGLDSRHVAIKAANYLQHTGIADTARFGPQVEFFVFDRANFQSSAQEAFYRVEFAAPAARGIAPASLGDGPLDLGVDARPRVDRLLNVHGEMMQAMLACGVSVESHQRLFGFPGQGKIGLNDQPLVTAADWTQISKYCIRHVARQQGRAATFMPQPIEGVPGSGMPLGFALWRDDDPLFAGGGYAGLSEIALYAIGGILKHAPALLALTSPTTNSFKRLTPANDAPVNLVYSRGNRAAACRVPAPSQDPRAMRIEFRCPDPTCNPYLAFAAITMAAIDGIQLKLTPGPPLDTDFHALTDADRAGLQQTPATLAAALDALETGGDFLLKGGVFTPELVETWIRYKRTQEVAALRMRPHPYEFCLYFDA
jgi:glutamine synthetase